MFLGYNTNGFAHHRLEDAVEIIAELGYGGVALTPDVNHLDPLRMNLTFGTAAVEDLLRRVPVRTVIETGARFILDPRRKHQPTLISPTADGRKQRREFVGLA